MLGTKFLVYWLLTVSLCSKHQLKENKTLTFMHVLKEFPNANFFSQFIKVFHKPPRAIATIAKLVSQSHDSELFSVTCPL